MMHITIDNKISYKLDKIRIYPNAKRIAMNNVLTIVFDDDMEFKMFIKILATKSSLFIDIRNRKFSIRKNIVTINNSMIKKLRLSDNE
jgi:hypothetical protein